MNSFVYGISRFIDHFTLVFSEDFQYWQVVIGLGEGGEVVPVPLKEIVTRGTQDQAAASESLISRSTSW